MLDALKDPASIASSNGYEIFIVEIGIVSFIGAHRQWHKALLGNASRRGYAGGFILPLW